MDTHGWMVAIAFPTPSFPSVIGNMRRRLDVGVALRTPRRMQQTP
jgi:hypothetical protein